MDGYLTMECDEMDGFDLRVKNIDRSVSMTSRDNHCSSFLALISGEHLNQVINEPLIRNPLIELYSILLSYFMLYSTWIDDIYLAHTVEFLARIRISLHGELFQI